MQVCHDSVNQQQMDFGGSSFPASFQNMSHGDPASGSAHAWMTCAVPHVPQTHEIHVLVVAMVPIYH